MTRHALRFLDWQGDLIRRVFDRGQNQLRLGVVSLDIGLLIGCLLPTSDEPPLIFVMSALSLILAGVTLVLQAVLNIQATEETG